MRDRLRMLEWLIVAGVIAYYSQAQLPVVIYKALLVTLFAFLGYWIDRRLFVHSREVDSIDAGTYASMNLRRAIIVAAVVIAGALAL